MKKVKLEMTEEFTGENQMWYSVRADGKLVAGSFDKERAERIFNNTKEVLEAGKKLEPVTIKVVDIEIN